MGRFLLLHGWNGNKPEHWQEWLASELTSAGHDVSLPRMPDPTAPRLAAWLTNLHAAVCSLTANGDEITVVAHSLGSITWMHYATAAASAGVASRVLLVAPPYVAPDVLPIDAPVTIKEFFPPPLVSGAIAAASFQTDIIASDNDKYATYDQVRVYSERLGVPLHLMSGAGHISSTSGYGPWPWVFDWCVGSADLPPKPTPH